MPLLYDPEQAIADLSKADKKLGKAMRRLGPVELDAKSMGNPFQYLARAITFQQLSCKAAGTIFGRVKDLFPRKHLKPQLVLDLPEEALRGAGLSRNKLAAIRDLAAKTLDGTVPTLTKLKTLSDDEIIERLLQVRGVGPWTVEMLLIFHLGRPDVLPTTDLGIRKGYKILEGREEMPTPKELLTLTEHWCPWRSVASWYLYRLADGEAI